MSFMNGWGDLEITNPQVMRALAHPTRLALLTQLQRGGPATATQLSEVVEASPSALSWHLRHLASFGLVREAEGERDRRQRWWEATSRGITIEPGEGPEAEASYRLLSDQMFGASLAQVQQWATGDGGQLTGEWLGEGGSSNTGLMLTAQEMAQVQRKVMDVLTPYLSGTREPAPGQRRVRYVRFSLPESEPESEAEPS